MSDIKIKTVKSKGDLMAFIKLPWKIYKNDPYWVPHLIMDRKKILNKEENPFFKHADAEYFLAEKNGNLVGRIAAIKNDLHNQIHKDKVGFFGFFECFDDQDAANALFDKAKEWLQSRGLEIMRGPANPSFNDEVGMLMEGFDDTPRFLMTFNPQYYLKLCDNYGFTKAKDLYAYKMESKKMRATEKIQRVSDLARKRYKLNIRPLNMKDFNNELEKVKYVYNTAWEPNWGFVPMTDEEINAMAKDLKMLVEPSIVIFGEIESKIVGFALVMLDYNQILKNMNGKLFPFGIIKLFTQRKKITWARIIILGLIPEFQKKGLDAVFYWEILERAGKLGIHLGEASWILEDNDMMNRGAEAMNAFIYKKYRIYDIKI
jgi:GNAT superfamily N-acetyltransferase